MSEPVIQVRNLRKEYKNFTAVGGIDFTVYKGDVFGFLGPNGAGKSTTIRMITSLITPTSGEITLFGIPLAKSRTAALQRIGAIVERPDLYGYLSAYTNLRIFAKLTRADTSRKHLMSILETVGLASRAESKVKTFSHGMKQRMGIATALVHDPDLIILDEPTTGLDPQGMKEIREIIDHLAKERGKTVFLSSHILPEVEMSANRMLIINRGKIVVEGGVQELLNTGKMSVDIRTDETALATNALRNSPFAASIIRTEEKRVVLSLERSEIPAVVDLLVGAGAGIQAVIPTRSLEEYFLSMVATAESSTGTQSPNQRKQR
ncbi:MAG: ABC transporter ATP-binding protein [Candidatus Kapabacteria bacterium]|nr:ABC transporter ATP-binding protein [Candidatus Kapabacteria bacterium]